MSVFTTLKHLMYVENETLSWYLILNHGKSNFDNNIEFDIILKGGSRTCLIQFLDKPYSRYISWSKMDKNSEHNWLFSSNFIETTVSNMNFNCVYLKVKPPVHPFKQKLLPWSPFKRHCILNFKFLKPVSTFLLDFDL